MNQERFLLLFITTAMFYKEITQCLGFKKNISALKLQTPNHGSKIIYFFHFLKVVQTDCGSLRIKRCRWFPTEEHM